MKYVWLFLALALVVIMAQPGDCKSKLKGDYKQAKKALKEQYNLMRDIQKMNKRYGSDWLQKAYQSEGQGQAQEQGPEEPADSEETAEDFIF